MQMDYVQGLLAVMLAVIMTVLLVETKTTATD